MRRYEVYCDASMNRKRRTAGLGLVILDKETNTTKEFSTINKLTKSSSFIAELFAMAFTCETLVNLDIDLEDVTVWCDCMPLVLKTADIPEPDGKNIAVDLAWKMILLAKTFGIDIKWVKGHSLNRWNCRADKLAGEAAKSVKRSDWSRHDRKTS